MRDFAAHLVPKPKNLNFVLPEASPLDFEIGAGQGLHAIRYALAHPERTLIAVESTHERFGKMSGRFAAHEAPENLKLIHADAVAFATHCLEDATLDRVFLLYPNPYPKPKQANLRWHNRPFMRLLLARMKANATLTLATNLKWYADEAEDRLVNAWGLQLSERSAVDPASRRTHFEKKYLARGETCFNLVLRKRDETGSIEV